MGAPCPPRSLAPWRRGWGKMAQKRPRGSEEKTADKKRKISTGGIEPPTFCVLSRRHNRLDHVDISWSSPADFWIHDHKHRARSEDRIGRAVDRPSLPPAATLTPDGGWSDARARERADPRAEPRTCPPRALLEPLRASWPSGGRQHTLLQSRSTMTLALFTTPVSVTSWLPSRAHSYCAQCLSHLATARAARMYGVAMVLAMRSGSRTRTWSTPTWQSAVSAKIRSSYTLST